MYIQLVFKIVKKAVRKMLGKLTTGLLPESKVNASRYKTELCRPYQENGSCKYGEKCQFAHGQSGVDFINILCAHFAPIFWR